MGRKFCLSYFIRKKEEHVFASYVLDAHLTFTVDPDLHFSAGDSHLDPISDRRTIGRSSCKLDSLDED